MPGATPIWEGVPPRPRDLGGGGYPYHHHHGFGSGAGVPGSPLPTTTIFNVGGRTPRARKPKKKEMRRAEKESLDREKTLNSERVRKQCVGKR